jgi:hypothetical protein
LSEFSFLLIVINFLDHRDINIITQDEEDKEENDEEKQRNGANLRKRARKASES